MDSDEKNVCGICLLEEGNSIRGYIDSCEHHFCFVCIMEWSKVEIRCPMCKSRFSSIRSPPKHEVFPSERIVNVPVRNQVNHALGLTTITHADPYAEVSCVWCHSVADEPLLLLCDLCNTAAHTYCVGLGATVPEGDWFCSDCTVSRADHASVEVDADGKKDSTEVSIFDIVRGPVILYRDRLPNCHLKLEPNPDAERTQGSGQLVNLTIQRGKPSVPNTTNLDITAKAVGKLVEDVFFGLHLF